jgi:hypothetical protein
MSVLGASLSSAAFRQVTRDSTIWLHSVTAGDVERTVGLACEVARVDTIDGVPTIGIDLSDHSPEAMRIFLEAVYRPLYMCYLADLAAGKMT